MWDGAKEATKRCADDLGRRFDCEDGKVEETESKAESEEIEEATSRCGRLQLRRKEGSGVVDG